MRRTRTIAASGCTLVASALLLLVTSSPAADLRQPARSARRAIEPEAPQVLSSAEGVTAVALSPEEMLRAEEIFRLHAPSDDASSDQGGGADVSALQLFQTYFLDSGCPFPAACRGPCNNVLMIWKESTRNPDGVEVSVDGVVVDIIPGRTTVPGLNGVNLWGARAGSRTFRAKEVVTGSSVEGTITVLDSQPFSDPIEVRCRPAGVSQGTSCRLLVTWQNVDPVPGAYDVYLDDVYLGPVNGQEDRRLVEKVPPGRHGVRLQGIQPETATAFYYGCMLETFCDVACTDGPCDPPVALRLAQATYGAGNVNTVRAEWINGEEPYGVGIRAYVDGAVYGMLPTDPEAGTTTSAMLGGLTPGPHEVGFQGVCRDPGFLSTITEDTITLLGSTPHGRPIDGGLTCTFNPSVPSTVVTWKTGDQSLFIDVYLITDGTRYFLGTIPGESNTLTVRGTSAEDQLELQFFACSESGCYGSELYCCGSDSSPCGPPVPGRYVQGLCNGVGTADGKPLITSAIFGLAFLFSGGPPPPCRKACDSNGDGNFDISDMVYVLSYLFVGGPAPPSWTDRTGDGVADPTCLEVQPSEECSGGHAFCSG